MRLCGLDVPYECECVERVTSNRINQTAQSIEQEALAYDDHEILGILRATQDAAHGIVKAVRTKEPRDLEGRVIQRPVVLDELATLADDLETIVNKVQDAMRTEAGKIRWKLQEGDQALAKALDPLSRSVRRMRLERF